MNYEKIKEQILVNGLEAIRPHWGVCRSLRAAKEEDEEYINYPYIGIVVDTCDERKCDCKTVIFQPTPDDLKATDWTILVR